MDLELKNREWKAFVFSGFFKITTTSSSIDRNKLINKKGVTPYITRSDNDNGYDSFICEQANQYEKDANNVITIGLDTQTVFYQPHDFYTGQNIQILANKNLNQSIALFLIPLIKRQMTKFSWGGNGATLTRLKRSKILLPVNAEGQTDYAFMEAYMRQKEQEKLKAYQTYITKRLEQVGGCNPVEPLSRVQWREFEIGKLFCIKAGKRLTKHDMKKGSKPFIGATDSNNGITAYVSNSNASEDTNILGVNYNGSVVENFYHSYTAIFSDDVKRLSFKETEGNQYLYLFAKNQILKQKDKFQYGYKFNATRMSKQKIMLPITTEGQPDYSYMENFVKQLERQKLLAYCQHKGFTAAS